MTLMLVQPLANEVDFLALFNRLCVALREAQDDSGITQGVYWDALKDVPLEALEAGAAALMRQRDRRFFPTTAEWRSAAEQAQYAQLKKALPVGREQPWTHECADCEDTGWIVGLVCDGRAHGACGRAKKHDPHAYTQACPCRPTNRTYRRHQAFGSGAA